LSSRITELDAEHLKTKERTKTLTDELKALKGELSDKNDQIDELQKRVSRLTSENNGFQRIISIYDSERNNDENQDGDMSILYKRINELEQIIVETKKTTNDSSDLKLINNQVFHLPEQVC
jgi:chromosome segregation ATPase